MSDRERKLEVLLGEMMSFIATGAILDHCDEHWVHAYAPLYRRLVEYGTRNFPGNTIAGLIEDCFGPQVPQTAENAK